MEDHNKKLKELIEARGPYKIYQAWSKIGIDGQRPVEERYKIYGLDHIINRDTTVLDLGSNVGFMSLRCAADAMEVHGLERYDYWVEIAEQTAKYLGIENTSFHVCDALAFKTPYEFDLILSLSFHHWNFELWAKYVEIVYKGFLVQGGKLLFESHKLGPREPFEAYAEFLCNRGFKIIDSGRCQCRTNYPRPNPLRKWYLMELARK